MAEQPTLFGINDLPRQQREASLIAVRMREATRAEAWDAKGRQGAVDAMLTLKDGRTAAFEVTNLAAEGALETASVLARYNHKWPLPGKWFWSIEVGSPQDLRRLKQCYEKSHPDLRSGGYRLPRSAPACMVALRGPGLQWLTETSTCNMVGHPEQLASCMRMLISRREFPVQREELARIGASRGEHGRPIN